MCLSRKRYIQTVGFIFAIVAVLHLVRAGMGLPAVIAGFSVPTWASWLTVVVSGFLSYNAFWLACEK